MTKVFIDGLSFALPLLIMAVGAIYSEKSGVTNLAVEGFQGFGAFIGSLIAILLMPVMGEGNQAIIYIAMLGAAAGGGLYACLHALLCIRFRANQVISGVGFLGAGCILVTGQHRIKGVTTAAGIWAAACLGLCIGAGDYMVAGIVLLMVILTMTVFRTFDEMIITRTRYMRLFMELSSVHAVTELMRYLQTRRIKVNDTEFLDKKNNEYIAMVIDIELQKSSSVEETIAEFEQVEGVRFVSEI